MGGRRRLRGGLEHVFPDHRSHEGVTYRRVYTALAEELPLTTDLLKFEASRVALLGVIALNASRALTDKQAQALRGKGRRPSPRDIERLARRQGLADQSYSAALDELRGLAGQRRPQDLASLVARKADQEPAPHKVTQPPPSGPSNFGVPEPER